MIGRRTPAGLRLGGNPILAIQFARLWNAVRSAWAVHPGETAFVATAALLLLAYEAADTYRAVSACGACRSAVQAHAGMWLAATLVGAFGQAFVAARWSAARVDRLARAHWLAVLPWPEDARQRAARGAVRAIGVAAVGAAGFVVWIISRALHLEHGALAHFEQGALAHLEQGAMAHLEQGALAAGAAALSAGAGFYAGARTADAAPGDQYGGAQAGVAGAPAARGAWRLLDALDRAAPRHASAWAWSDRMALILSACCLSVLPFGAAAAAVTLTQHQAMPVLAMPVLALPVLALAVQGGNAVFVATLRCNPMNSAVFRASSLGFAAACAAMVRAPLALSASWFAAVLVVPLGGDWRLGRMVPAALVALLLLDGLYAAAAVFRPASPRQALLLYAAGIYAMAYETGTGGVPYGALTLAAVVGLSVLLTRRGRIAYRSGHG